MFATTHTVAFAGIDVLKINIEVQITDGLPSFTIVGLADKAVAESRERVRSALHSVGLALPGKHITVNLAPADVVKEGTHYDLPIAMALLGAMEIFPADRLLNCLMMGELSLDGTVRTVSGVLPASMASVGYEMGFVCPAPQAQEALWSGTKDLVPAQNLLQLIQHFKGTSVIVPPVAMQPLTQTPYTLDMADVKGHESAKRALEIAAVGGHNLLMIGPPGSGKSMLASRLPSILPELSAEELLEISKIHSVAGLLKDGQLITQRPYRAPHHSASTPAMVGGGMRAKPGEISLAHRGVLFLDELPEFSRQTLEALRQPLETGTVSVARANSHISYPARFQLIAAMNPCRCGYLGVPGRSCSRAPKCAEEYQAKISGPMLDRIDLQIEVPLLSPWTLGSLGPAESSAIILERVKKARAFQARRQKRLNAEIDGTELEQTACLTEEARKHLIQMAEKSQLSGRGFHRMIRVARTLADMSFSENILPEHVTEAFAFRRPERKE